MTSNDDVPGSPGAGPAEECRGVTLEHEGGSGGEVERARERLRPDPERRARSQDRALDRDGQDWPGREAVLSNHHPCQDTRAETHQCHQATCQQTIILRRFIYKGEFDYSSVTILPGAQY